jgi:hypothetical protein
MPIVNPRGVPDEYVRAVENSAINYEWRSGALSSKPQMSVTEVISPAQMQALLKTHKDTLEEDVVDRLWALDGTLVHLLLERAGAGPNDDILETTLLAEHDGVILKGTVDQAIRADHSLNDHKRTSMYATKDGVKPEWKWQLNLYRWLWHQNFPNLNYHTRKWHELQNRTPPLLFGPINKLTLKAWYKEREAERPIEALDVEIYDMTEIEEYLSVRIHMHKIAREGQQVDCADEERWGRPTRYAVMKKGRKSAVRVYDDQKVAADHVRCESGTTLQHRQGRFIRCQGTERERRPYCPVAHLCPQLREERDL